VENAPYLERVERTEVRGKELLGRRSERKRRRVGLIWGEKDGERRAPEAASYAIFTKAKKKASWG